MVYCTELKSYSLFNGLQLKIRPMELTVLGKESEVGYSFVTSILCSQYITYTHTFQTFLHLCRNMQYSTDS